MIKLENTDVTGWESAIRGMRNPMNSWDKSDSAYGCKLKKGRDPVNWDVYKNGDITYCTGCGWCDILCDPSDQNDDHKEYIIGPNDLILMKKLIKGGTDHRKFMRMITVYVDIAAPLYWWKEFDTYKIGTVANSCSTMHKIADKEFTLDDFSCEHLEKLYIEDGNKACDDYDFKASLITVIINLNIARTMFLKTKDKKYFDIMIQLLPSSYNQKRTIMMNYEVLANIYNSRKNHKLNEWRELCAWIDGLPYSELITVKENE